MNGTLAKSQCLINVAGDVESAKFSLSGKTTYRDLRVISRGAKCGTD